MHLNNSRPFLSRTLDYFILPLTPKRLRGTKVHLLQFAENQKYTNKKDICHANIRNLRPIGAVRHIIKKIRSIMDSNSFFKSKQALHLKSSIGALITFPHRMTSQRKFVWRKIFIDI